MTSALQSGLKLKQISSDLRDIVNSYAGLNRNERYAIYVECYKLCRAARRYKKGWQAYLGLYQNYDKVCRAVRTVKASCELRSKKNRIHTDLTDGKTIFWLCSWHPDCAEDHRAWQSRIYCHRYWRQIVSGKDYYAVLSYIKNRGIKTVQEIMGPPVYLTTRPYCRHYFVPLDIATVLTSGVKSLVKEYGMSYESEYDYYGLRDEVYSRMNSIEPCAEFNKKNRGN